MVTVFIYLPGETKAVPAGRYNYNAEDRSGSFIYLREYRSLSGAIPVDAVEFPLDMQEPRKTFINEGLHGALRDSVPDLWGRLVIEKLHGLPVGAREPERLLLLSDASRVGNLDFRSSETDGEPEFGPPAVEQLNELIEAAASIENDMKISEHLRLLLLRGTSMGGARPKCLVEDGTGLWVAKLPSKYDTWNNARVEMAVMRLAESCGICVPEMRIEETERGDILLLRRFDREKTNKGYTRVGYLSALSVMGMDENEFNRHSYLHFAGRLKSYFPASWTPKQGEELFRRILFNIFARNTDDHARNHGVLLRGGQVRLSPAFDITPREATSGVGTQFYLAMAIGPRGRLADVDNAIAGAPHFGLTPKKAAAIVFEVAEQVGRWKEYFESAGVNEKDTERFAATFESLQRTVSVSSIFG